MTKVRWAMVGTSGFAVDWLALGIKLGSNPELTAIVNRDVARGKVADEKVGETHVITSIETINKNVVDGVFLCLPNTQYVPYAWPDQHTHHFSTENTACTLSRFRREIF